MPLSGIYGTDQNEYVEIDDTGKHFKRGSAIPSPFSQMKSNVTYFPAQQQDLKEDGEEEQRESIEGWKWRSEKQRIRLPSSNVGSYSRLSAFLIFFFPALGGLLFGYDIGATSAVVSQLKSATYAGVLWTSKVRENSTLQGVITSMATLGALIGSLACFQVT
jgi:hypothetical protein